MILHILHTNDLHSHFHNMPQIAACLKRNRTLWQARGEQVLTVDIGDHVDRMNMTTEASWGQTNVEVLNKSGYQYVTIGNNEGLTLPKEKLDILYDHADFSVILSNLLQPTGTLPHWAVPYVIHRCDGIRLAILGATAAFQPFYEMTGWKVIEPLPIIEQQVKMLRPQADAVILLSHLGYSFDRRIAESIAGIDVILGGHTHHLLPKGERVGSTLIAQTGKYGEHVGHVQLLFADDSRQLVDSSAELFSSCDYPADQEIAAFLQQQKEQAESLLAQPIARLSDDLPINWEEEAPLASFLAASLRQWTEAEIGLANSGLLLTSLDRGEVTQKELLSCLPHPINACAMTLTGKQLLKVLSDAISPQVVNRELRGFGFRGKMMGWMGIDGLQVEYEPGAHPQICRIEVNRQPLELEREYRVATVDMFIFNRMFPELLAGKDLVFFRPDMLREIVAKTLSDERLVQASFLSRWQKAEPPAS